MRMKIGFLIAVSLMLFNPSRGWAVDERIIQPNDQISIQVTGEPTLSQNYQVDDQGDISVDNIGKVHLAGFTAKKAESELRDHLKKFLKIFDVRIAFPTDEAGTVLVFGEVTHPGSVKVRSGDRYLDALAEAGQLTQNADTKRIILLHKSDGKTETLDYDAALRNPALNVPIFSGDTMTIPSRISVTIQVDGEVQSPGLRPLDQNKTAYLALLSADPTSNADWKRVEIRRLGSAIPMEIDLSAVRTGRMKDDLQLQAGDQITILSRFNGEAILRGEVKNPGEKPLNGRTLLSDFIHNAGGGFTDIADKTSVEVIRDGQAQRTVNLLEIENGQSDSDDPKLEVLPGDVIFVPNDEKKRFAIVGGVIKPGAYPIERSMTLLDAIFMADGFSANLSKKQPIILAPKNIASDARFKNDPEILNPLGSSSDKSSHAVKSSADIKDKPYVIQNGLVLINYKKVESGELNLALSPGDRILVPVEEPHQPKQGFLDQISKLSPLASLLLVSGVL